MMVGVCMECDEHIEIDEEADVEEIIVCPKCGARYEIIDLDPVMLDHAAKSDG
jgi:lysine biosynthesis protein LysW